MHVKQVLFIFVILAIIMSACAKTPVPSAPVAPAAPPAVAVPTPSAPAAPVPTRAVLEPVSGNSVVLRDCAAEPRILEVSEGTEVTFQNEDDREHKFIMSSHTQEYVLPAKGSVKITATAPMPIPFTDNFYCDDTPTGAIFISS